MKFYFYAEPDSPNSKRGFAESVEGSLQHQKTFQVFKTNSTNQSLMILAKYNLPLKIQTARLIAIGKNHIDEKSI